MIRLPAPPGVEKGTGRGRGLLQGVGNLHPTAAGTWGKMLQAPGHGHAPGEGALQWEIECCQGKGVWVGTGKGVWGRDRKGCLGLGQERVFGVGTGEGVWGRGRGGCLG